MYFRGICVCQSTLTKITGQLARVIPLLSCVGPGDGTQGVGLGSRHLYKLIHLTDSDIWLFKKWAIRKIIKIWAVHSYWNYFLKMAINEEKLAVCQKSRHLVWSANVYCQVFPASFGVPTFKIPRLQFVIRLEVLGAQMTTICRAGWSLTLWPPV